jgi:hypothetical protein
MARIAGEHGREFVDQGTAKAILEDCMNDPAAAVLRLVRVNHYLMRENERLLRAASPVSCVVLAVIGDNSCVDVFALPTNGQRSGSS